MMQEINDEEAPAPVPAPMETEEAEETTDITEEVIDRVCDPCGLVPKPKVIEAAFAHKKKVKQEREEKAKLQAEADALLANQFEPEAVESPKEEDTGYFNIDCCGKAPSADIQDTEFPAEKLPTDEDLDVENPDEGCNGETASVANQSQQTRSLAEIAAKMDAIDLETAAEDTAADQISDTGSLQKGLTEWYKEPLYASLIVLCGAFSIAIIVLAILLIKS